MKFDRLPNATLNLLCNYCDGPLGAHALPVGKYEHQLLGFCSRQCQNMHEQMVMLYAMGVDVEQIKQSNPTELQLIDLVGGLETCFRAKGEFPRLVGRSLPAGELVTQ